MDSLKEIVNKTDVHDMFSGLVQTYPLLLGIEVVMQDESLPDPVVLYILKDPKKLPFSHQYGVNFLLDPQYDMPVLLEQYFNYILNEANEAELNELQLNIEKNRKRQTIFDSADLEFKADIVKLYLDSLYAAVMTRQR